jgi:16S rRNA (cytosine967-C5)-methyltransferase
LVSAPLAQAFAGASQVVAEVIGGRTLDSALARLPLTGSLRAAVQDLAYGALRQFGRGDFLLSRLLERPLRDPQVRALLLAALYRLEARGDDAHTTVDQAVTAASRLGGGRYRGLVNAVLRTAQRQRDELAIAGEDVATARWRHPAWWLESLQRDFPHEWPDIATAGNGHPPMTLRVNRRHGDAAACVAELASVGVGARALDDTAVLLSRPMAVEAVPGFADGRVSVQDWGAQQAARLLDVRPGMRVLDACAAPGGKTGHLCELADLDLTALDSDAERARRIDTNLERLGLQARVVVADCRQLATWWDGRPFDRLLADVPCSASGVVRRHPDIKWLRRPTDIAGFAARQREIVEVLWQALAPGGKMLYATCSVFAEENGRQVAAFVADHADARRVPMMDGNEDWQLTPNTEHDGFYYALLEKRA